MRKLIVLLLTVVAAVTALPAAATATVTAASAAGLTVSARWVLLADSPASVVLVGRYACGPFAAGPLSGTVDLNVDQVTNGVTAHAIGYLTPTACDGAAHWFATELTTVNGATFRRASATWTGSGYVQGQEGFQNVFVPPTRIRIS